jgi:hypothetical protein
MPLTNPFEINPRDYKYGDKGDHVRALQEALVFAGYEITVDGDFGKETKGAIEQFESDHAYNNTLSFAVDIRTLTMLFNQVCIDPGPTPPPPDPEPEPPEPPPSIDVPKGKGMFVRSLTGTGTVDNMKQYIIDRGIKWVCVQRLWQHDDPSDDKYLNGSSWEDYKRAWEETGCDLWIWGWPLPERQDEFVSEMSETCSKWGALGIVIDVEGKWYDHHAEATELIDKMMALGVPVGVTSYGAPWYHTRFPFEEFNKADFGVPQIYDSENSMPEDYPSRSIEEWTKFGYTHLVPASSAYKTPALMEDLLSRTPVPDDSLIWWDWYNANLDQSGGRWDVIGAYEIPVNARRRIRET